MKLDLNFNALTKLREWWKQVQNNFKTIEAECNETREIAENALTAEQAEEYMSEFINSTPEYTEAIESFAELIAEHGGSVEALEDMFGKRLRYYLYEEQLDADTITDDAIYFCKAGTLNTPDEAKNGILLNFCGVCQYLLTSDGRVYSRADGGEWYNEADAVRDEISALSTVVDGKSEVVFGTYTGNGSADRFIELDFEPIAVEVYADDGAQYNDSSTPHDYYGGLALKDNPCMSDAGLYVIKIDGNGFYVTLANNSNRSRYIRTNTSGSKYYFKAYKNGEIIKIS